MSSSGPRSRRRWVAAVLAVAGAGYVAAYLHLYSRYPADDAFIHLRIARNFVSTGLPYYDPAERVAASSSVLWTLMVSGAFAMFGARVEVVAWLELVLTLAVTGVCAWLLAERLSPAAAVLAAIGVVAAFLLHVSAALMETPVAVLLLLLSLVCWRARRYAALGLCAGTALLARYEAAVWLVLAFALLPDRKARARFVAGAAGPLAFAVVFNLFYFGTLIPNTVWAKSRVYRLAVADFFGIANLKGWRLASFVAGCALLLREIVRARGPDWLRAAAMFPVALFASYAAARTMMFMWYWPLILVPLALASVLALPPRALSVAGLLLLLATRPFWTNAAAEAYGVATGNPSRFREFAGGARVQQYLRIGADLAARSPGAALMSSEIGALGWSFPGKIVDAGGLVSPACLAFHPMAVPEERSRGFWGAIPVGAVQAFAPDLVVSMDIFSEAFRRAQADGRLSEYALVAEYPVVGSADAALSDRNTVWGSRSIQVFARR